MPNTFTDIIIPVWNNLSVTQHCVDLIRKNTIVPYRLIISDGASTDGTGEWLRAQDDIIALIAEVNEGNITAWNRGLEISTAPYIAFMNNDVEVPRGWLGLLIEGLENSPTAGAISAKATDGVPPSARPEGVVVGPDPAGFGGCSVMKREVVQEIGLWDEAFTFAYDGDYDYAYRMKLAGWQFAIHYGVIVNHFPGAVTIKSKGEYDKYVERGKCLIREKYPNVPLWGGTAPFFY